MNIRWGNEQHLLLVFSITHGIEKCRCLRLIRTKTPTKNCLFYYYFLVSYNIYALAQTTKCGCLATHKLAVDGVDIYRFAVHDNVVDPRRNTDFSRSRLRSIGINGCYGIAIIVSCVVVYVVELCCSYLIDALTSTIDTVIRGYRT